MKDFFRDVRCLARETRQEFVAGDAVEYEELFKTLESHGFTTIYDLKARRYSVEKTQAGFLIRIPTRTSEHEDRQYLANMLGAWLIYGRAERRPFEGLDIQSRGAIAAFAAEFLMPRAEFTKYAESVGYDYKEIALHFQVSQSSAMIRMIALGLKMRMRIQGRDVFENPDGTTTYLDDEEKAPDSNPLEDHHRGLWAAFWIAWFVIVVLICWGVGKY